MQTPFGVHKETWITVGTFVANNMDSFHNLKSLELSKPLIRLSDPSTIIGFIVLCY